MLHDHLLDSSRRVTVHENAFARLAHLEHFVLVHGAKDELFCRHVNNELLGLDHVKHLAYLLLAEGVHEVNLVEVDKHCVLAGLRERASHLAFMHLHQALNHTIVLARQHRTQRMNHVLLVRSLLVFLFGGRHEIRTLDSHFLVKLHLALLHDKELIQGEIFLRQHHLPRFALSDHDLRRCDFEVAVGDAEEYVDLGQEDDHGADFLFSCLCKQFFKPIKLYLEKDELIGATAVGFGAVTLDVTKLVGELIVDDYLVPGQEEKVLTFVRFAPLVAMVGQDRFDQALPKDADN